MVSAATEHILAFFGVFIFFGLAVAGEWILFALSTQLPLACLAASTGYSAQNTLFPGMSFNEVLTVNTTAVC